MEKEYVYGVKASSTGFLSGVAVAEEIQPSIAFTAPPEFQGEAGHWTPEHFFVAAVASCVISTFSGMARASKFDFLSLEIEAEGILGKDEGGWRFRQIDLRPRLKIAQEEGRERANRLLLKAEKSCLVARSVSCQVVLESEIVVEEELLAREKIGNSVPIS